MRVGKPIKATGKSFKSRIEGPESIFHDFADKSEEDKSFIADVKSLLMRSIYLTAVDVQKYEENNWS